MRCFGCGCEKSSDDAELYPYDDNHLVMDEPIPALFSMDCEGRKAPGEPSDWRAVVVCHHCFHKLDPDMWIDDRGWNSINPKVRFENLPALQSDSPNDITVYASTAVPP